jgi:hypothetical protein
MGLAEGEKLNEADFAHIPHEVIIGIGSLDNMVSPEESVHASSLLPNGSLGNT